MASGSLSILLSLALFLLSSMHPCEDESVPLIGVDACIFLLSAVHHSPPNDVAAFRQGRI